MQSFCSCCLGCCKVEFGNISPDRWLSISTMPNRWIAALANEWSGRGKIRPSPLLLLFFIIIVVVVAVVTAVAWHQMGMGCARCKNDCISILAEFLCAPPLAARANQFYTLQ